MSTELPDGTTLRLLLLQCGCPVEQLRSAAVIRLAVEGVAAEAGGALVEHAGYEDGDQGCTFLGILPGARLALQSFPQRDRAVLVEVSVDDRHGDHAHRAHTLAHGLRAAFSPARFISEPAGLRPGTINLDRAHSPWVNEPLVHVPLLLHPRPRSVILCPDGESGMTKEALRHSYLRQLLVVSSREGTFRLGKLTAAAQAPPEPQPLPMDSSTRPDGRLDSPADVVIVDLFQGADASLVARAVEWLGEGGLVAFRLSDVRDELSALAEALGRAGAPPRFYWQHAPEGGYSLFGVVGHHPTALPTEAELAARLQDRKLSGLQIVSPATFRAMFALPPVVSAWLAPVMVD